VLLRVVRGATYGARGRGQPRQVSLQCVPATAPTPRPAPRRPRRGPRWLSDAHGRRACLIASNIATGVCCLLCAAAPAGYFWAFVAARAATGLAAAGLPIGAYLLATEPVGPARRGAAGLINQVRARRGRAPGGVVWDGRGARCSSHKDTATIAARPATPHALPPPRPRS
jgi:hypothetical protein